MRLKKTERISAMVKILSDHPNEIFTLGDFAERFQAAKSTLSEDVVVVKSVFEKLNLGRIVTIAGASGGMKYVPLVNQEQAKSYLESLCQQIQLPQRRLTGGFLYLIDLIYNPNVAVNIGRLFASAIDYTQGDYVVTIETKGIPMALMVAQAMNLPLVIIRKNAKVAEGPAISVNYVSRDSRSLQSMSLARKSIGKDARVILIDDFMRGGGTLQGMENLMQEFEAQVIAKGIFIEAFSEKPKSIQEYISLLTLYEDPEKTRISPNPHFLQKLQQ